MSKKFTLNQEDLRKWAFNVLRFVLIPTALAFLTAYQGSLDVKVAWGVALGTAFNSAHDLLRRFLSGETK